MYDRPVGLACDNTKLLPALRPYYDQQRDNYYILGGTREPRLIANPEELTAIIRKGEVEKASKACQFHILTELHLIIDDPDSPLVPLGAFAQNTHYRRCCSRNSKQPWCRATPRIPRSDLRWSFATWCQNRIICGRWNQHRTICSTSSHTESNQVPRLRH
jgi:hypothetical protein